MILTSKHECIARRDHLPTYLPTTTTTTTTTTTATTATTATNTTNTYCCYNQYYYFCYLLLYGFIKRAPARGVKFTGETMISPVKPWFHRWNLNVTGEIIDSDGDIPPPFTLPIFLGLYQ